MNDGDIFYYMAKVNSFFIEVSKNKSGDTFNKVIKTSGTFLNYDSNFTGVERLMSNNFTLYHISI